MFGLAYGLAKMAWRKFCGNEMFRVLLVGPAASGKTHLLEKARELYDVGQTAKASVPAHRPLIVPTLGMNTAKIVADRVTLQFWDLGGRPTLRPLWKAYIRNAQAIVYVFDCSAPAEFDDAKEGLRWLLSLLQPPTDVPPPEQRSHRVVPVLLMANKEDLGRGTGSVAHLQAAFELPSSLPVHLEFSCALTGAGICDGMRWLVRALLGTHRLGGSVDELSPDQAAAWQSQRSQAPPAQPLLRLSISNPMAAVSMVTQKTRAAAAGVSRSKRLGDKKFESPAPTPARAVRIGRAGLSGVAAAADAAVRTHDLTTVKRGRGCHPVVPAPVSAAHPPDATGRPASGLASMLVAAPSLPPEATSPGCPAVGKRAGDGDGEADLLLVDAPPDGDGGDPSEVPDHDNEPLSDGGDDGGGELSEPICDPLLAPPSKPPLLLARPAGDGYPVGLGGESDDFHLLAAVDAVPIPPPPPLALPGLPEVAPDRLLAAPVLQNPSPPLVGGEVSGPPVPPTART